MIAHELGARPAKLRRLAANGRRLRTWVMSLRKALRSVVGDSRYARLAVYRRQRADRRYTQTQTKRELRVGKFELAAPSNHILFRLQETQPYRDLVIGILAGELAKKYPGETLVDIGANIGDTAALMATYSGSPLILVEASDFYCGFLRENAARFPNTTTIVQTFISANNREEGILRHAGGTARFEKVEGSGAFVNCRRLADVAGDARLIKIDTDGFDMAILSASLDYLAQQRPCLVYENEVRDEDTLTAANQLLQNLYQGGYRSFALFDDSGLHIASTTDLQILYDLNAYLFAVSSWGTERGLNGYDVLAAPAGDEDVLAGVTAQYRNFGAPQRTVAASG